MKIFKWVILSIVLLPVSAFAFYKPARVIMPEVFGMDCYQNICIDDSAKLSLAVSLVNGAQRELHEKWGLRINDPKVIFCSTERCQRNFGHSKTAGYTFGAFGIVIQPRGWKEYYVAHELIHLWQADKFGSLVLIFGEPWVTEGMAYSFSSDPRAELDEPFESYRKKFIEWYGNNESVPLEISISKVL